MKKIPNDFTNCVSGATTTLCWCIQLTGSNGKVLGFTDHDHDVESNGTLFRAESSVVFSRAESHCDFKVMQSAFQGALSSEAITESDISAGIYDNAKIVIYRVNWFNPTVRLLVQSGSIGNIRRQGGTYSADIFGPAHILKTPVGRSFCYLCDADVGDSRCGIDITAPAYTGTATVTAVTDNRRYTVSGLSGYANGWFGGGKLTWISGNNSGLPIEVKRHTKTSAAIIVEAWTAAPNDVAIGDTFTVSVGCDKSFSTCKSKFSNGVNHRGFPYMIGNDAVIAYAYGDTDLDGGSRYGN